MATKTKRDYEQRIEELKQSLELEARQYCATLGTYRETLANRDNLISRMNVELTGVAQKFAANQRELAEAHKIVADQHRSLCTLIRVLGEVAPEKEERRSA